MEIYVHVFDAVDRTQSSHDTRYAGAGEHSLYIKIYNVHTTSIMDRGAGDMKLGLSLHENFGQTLLKMVRTRRACTVGTPMPRHCSVSFMISKTTFR